MGEEDSVEEEETEKAVEKGEKVGKGKGIEEEKIVEERVYTVPLRRAWIAPIKKRAPRAMRILRDFMRKHMKVEDLVISEEVNEKIWRRGIEKPPRRIRVRVVKDKDGIVTVYLAD